MELVRKVMAWYDNTYMQDIAQLKEEVKELKKDMLLHEDKIKELYNTFISHQSILLKLGKKNGMIGTEWMDEFIKDELYMQYEKHGIEEAERIITLK
jgi:ABC-type uncharacterized transport system ATPase subunit